MQLDIHWEESQFTSLPLPLVCEPLSKDLLSPFLTVVRNNSFPLYGELKSHLQPAGSGLRPGAVSYVRVAFRVHSWDPPASQPASIYSPIPASHPLYEWNQYLPLCTLPLPLPECLWHPTSYKLTL